MVQVLGFRYRKYLLDGGISQKEGRMVGRWNAENMTPLEYPFYFYPPSCDKVKTNMKKKKLKVF